MANTVTAFTIFSPNTTIFSSEMNVNFDNLRGHRIPIEPSAASGSDATYDLGSSEYRWRDSYFSRYTYFGTPNTTGGWRIGVGATTTSFVSQYYSSTSYVNSTSFPEKTSSKTTTYTAVPSDNIIKADTSSAGWTLTLYPASGNSGKFLKIIKTTSDFNVLTIDGNGSETINGSTTTTLNTQYESITLFCDGSNWLILSRSGINTKVNIYTPSMSDGTNATAYGAWKRSGDCIEIEGQCVWTGAGAGTTFLVGIPSGLTISSARLSNGTVEAAFVGAANWNDNGTKRRTLHPEVSGGLISVLFREAETTNTWDGSQAASGDVVKFSVRVPISGWKGGDE